MNILKRSLPVLTIALLGVAIPQVMHAASAGAQNFFDIFVDIVSSVTPLIGTVAVFAIVVLGVRMVATTDESAMTKIKTTMTAIVAGLFLTLLAPNIVNIFYYDQAMTCGGFQICMNQIRVRIELLGIAQWFQALAVIIGVATIIISAFRALASFGNEGSVSAAKRQVLFAVGGIIVVVFSSPLFTIFGGVNTGAEQTFFDLRTPNALIEFVFYYVAVLLNFILIIMVAILVFAGVMLVANFGDDSRVEQVKGIVQRSIVGLILVLFSVVIVRTVLWFFGATN